jgi:hypothetical protein
LQKLGKGVRSARSGAAFPSTQKKEKSFFFFRFSKAYGIVWKAVDKKTRTIAGLRFGIHLIADSISMQAKRSR